LAPIGKTTQVTDSAHASAAIAFIPAPLSDRLRRGQEQDPARGIPSRSYSMTLCAVFRLNAKPWIDESISYDKICARLQSAGIPEAATAPQHSKSNTGFILPYPLKYIWNQYYSLSVHATILCNFPLRDLRPQT
jgi:hypothetical protein